VCARWRVCSAAVDAQKAANREQRERNRQLVAEVTDLKGGITALEERARSELGMVGNSETFYQVVTATLRSAAPATPSPLARNDRPALRAACGPSFPRPAAAQRFAAAPRAGTPSNTRPCLLGQDVLEWTLRALLAEPRVHAIVVVLSRR
jgi:hypothetical protein